MPTQQVTAPTAGGKVPLFDSKNFLSGLFFLGVGALGIFMAPGYPMGSALRMGPGYFPVVLSSLLILFGIYCLLQGLLKGH
jgi:putative tricarboxylic transport membrane protein